MVKKQDKEQEIEPFVEMEQLNLFFSLDIQDLKYRDSSNNLTIPNFSLQKNKRVKKLEYVDDRTGNYFTVNPHPDYGAPTIFDLDVLLYLISLLNEAIEKGENPSREIYFIPFRLFTCVKWIKSTKGKAGGEHYKRLDAALDRLSTAYNITNIETEDKGTKTHKWHWISEIKKTTNQRGKVEGIQVVIAEWLYKLIVEQRKVLSLSPAYFRLSRGIDRHLFRIFRKFLGNQDFFKISVERLYTYFPSGKLYYLFKRDLKKAVERNALPEMNLIYDKSSKDYIIATLKDGAKLERRLPYSMRTTADPVD
jgi:plasmid replication initiation protein